MFFFWKNIFTFVNKFENIFLWEKNLIDYVSEFTRIFLIKKILIVCWTPEYFLITFMIATYIVEILLNIIWGLICVWDIIRWGLVTFMSNETNYFDTFFPVVLEIRREE